MCLIDEKTLKGCLLQLSGGQVASRKQRWGLSLAIPGFFYFCHSVTFTEERGQGKSRGYERAISARWWNRSFLFPSSQRTLILIVTHGQESVFVEVWKSSGEVPAYH